MEPIQDTQKIKRFGIGLDTWTRLSKWGSIYLAAIVGANLIISEYGPALAVPVGFFLIGLDLTARDRLHDLLSGPRLPVGMALLIGAGSLLTWIINRGAGSIAIASFLAFAASATVDSFCYYLLREKSYLVKVNGSNIFGAAVDSAVFFLYAFGALSPLTALQFIAKVGGGFVWSLIIKRFTRSDDPEVREL